MSNILELVKQLREVTGASMMACKKVLEDNGGDYNKALDELRKKGAAKAMERSERQTGEGTIATYVHTNGKLAAMVMLGCETDFVARNENFVSLARDLAMQVAANNPMAVSPEEIDMSVVDKEKEIWRAQLEAEGKSGEMVEKIIEGKVNKFKSENCLLKQAFIKNPDMTVEQVVLESVNKLGENIKVVKFSRFSF